LDAPTFDSAVSANGESLVLSTQADLDPTVGNSDQNMEIFVYDTTSGQFTQVTETVGGIGRTPGGCEQYTPVLSADADRIAFAFFRFSVGGCELDGPQRNAADGFVFGPVLAVRKRPGNRAPILEVIQESRVEAGTLLVLNASATDADGDPIVFFAQLLNGEDLPAGAEIIDHRNGTATLRWETGVEQTGLYILRVASFDLGGGEAMGDVIVAVCSRIVADGDAAGVVAALFEEDPPARCRDSDLNGDHIISAADLVAANLVERSTAQPHFAI
jgi:hypothetical protein